MTSQPGLDSSLAHACIVVEQVQARELGVPCRRRNAAGLRGGQCVLMRTGTTTKLSTRQDAVQPLSPRRLEAIAERIQVLSIQACTAVGVSGMARWTFLRRHHRPTLLNEINTLPGFTSQSMYPMPGFVVTLEQLLHQLVKAPENNGMMPVNQD